MDGPSTSNPRAQTSSPGRGPCPRGLGWLLCLDALSVTNEFPPVRMTHLHFRVPRRQNLFCRILKKRTKPSRPAQQTLKHPELRHPLANGIDASEGDKCPKLKRVPLVQAVARCAQQKGEAASIDRSRVLLQHETKLCYDQTQLVPAASRPPGRHTGHRHGHHACRHASFYLPPLDDFGDDAREDDVDDGASLPRPKPPPPVAMLGLPNDLRLAEEDDGGGLLLEGLGLLEPSLTAGTRSLAKSWAWRVSLARRYLQIIGARGPQQPTQRPRP